MTDSRSAGNRLHGHVSPGRSHAGHPDDLSMLHLLTRQVRQILRGLTVRGTKCLVATLPLPVAVILKEQLELIEKLDYDRHEVFLSINSSLEHAIRTHSCKREPETVQWIEGFLHHGDVMFDIGANVGAYSLVAAKFSNGNARIYSFEPSFPSFAALCRNIALNRCADSIFPLNLALSDETAVGVFNYSDLSAGSSLHGYQTTRTVKGLFTPVLKQFVLSYQIDDLLRLLSIPVPNLIKIDVDGVELSILHGASETLKDKRVRTVLVEIEKESEHRDEIHEFLSEHGFQFAGPQKLGAPNAIFVRERQ